MELATTDQNAAKAFYTSLFGWSSTDSVMGPNQTYTMFHLEGREAAAAYSLQSDQLAQGVPPNWGLYISVTSADETAKKAAENGGKVLCAGFDVYNFGRMAVIADPTGAVFCVWQAKEHKGIGIHNQQGSFCWADLSTPNQARAAEFYTRVFGWSMPGGDNGYLHIVNGKDFIGGIPPAAYGNPNTPPHWLLYFQVDDCDGSTQKAKDLGANIFMGPMTMEKVGRMAVLADPQGAVFSLFQPSPR
jgi:uncharacterized protein